MKKGLSGKKVVLAASRKTEEMSVLVEKQGGVPLVRSLQGTVFQADDEVKPILKETIQQGFDWAIFTTGIGTQALIDIAEELSLKEDFMIQLNKANVATRGYKTFAVLSKLGLKPDVKDEDGTVAGLIEQLNGIPFAGKRVLVQLHGENVPSLIEFLQKDGATVIEMLPYQHVQPEKETLDRLVTELKKGEIDAICFTSAIQVRSFFHYLHENQYANWLEETLNEKVIAVAVGKVTAEALEEEGVTRIVYPELERMGAMILELSRYVEKKG
ncbi:uroporphyrinogen-III synthase [Halalkalibacter sp. AB-rgal2]|uniref:uroporphyrinogen-III synthase n=1 Tax=Halalkalibacter sp. AB-rgal2 TaxID=3242695 RepID=UPI00359DAA77